MEHRSSTRACHLTLFCTVPFVSFHVICLLSNSAILVRRQVCWGLALFRFPCGFHSCALLTTCPSGLLNMWPIQPQALYLTCLLVVDFTRSPNSQDVLRLLLTNICNFCSNFLVDLQVSELCKSTVFTFDPNTLSFVLVVSVVDRHIGHSITNTCLAFLIRA